jgi:phage-related protein
MSTFTYNSVTSDELGLIITNTIVRPTWAPEIEFTPIIGRPRLNPFVKSYYNNERLIVRAVIADAIPAKVRQIYNALRGSGELIISTAPNEFLNVYPHLPVPEAKAIMMAELPIEFECEPFAYSTTQQVVNITSATSYQTINYGGTAFCDPQIAYTANKASTLFDCNGKNITIITPSEIVQAGYPSTYIITLDCEGELAYYTKPNGDKVACTELTHGSFPRLHENENYILHDGVSAASLTYRERWY